MTITAVDATTIRPGTGGVIPGGKEIMLSSLAVGNGTLYITTVRDEGNADPAAVDTCYAPFAVAPPAHLLRLTKAKTTTGIPVNGSAPSGGFLIARTAGTSMNLQSETTSTSTVTDVVMFEFTLPDTYVAGAALPVIVNANYTGAGTLTAGFPTLSMTCSTFTAAGAQNAAQSVAAQVIGSSAAAYTFTVTAAQAVNNGMAPGSRVMLVFTGIVNSASGSNTLVINSVRYTA